MGVAEKARDLIDEWAEAIVYAPYVEAAAPQREICG